MKRKITFNKKTYTSFVQTKTKSRAKEFAKSYRSRGGLARVIKQSGKYKYNVMIHR